MTHSLGPNRRFGGPFVARLECSAHRITHISSSAPSDRVCLLTSKTYHSTFSITLPVILRFETIHNSVGQRIPLASNFGAHNEGDKNRHNGPSPILNGNNAGT